MPPWVIDIIMCFLVLGLTYALMSEGLWGAALMFFNVLFAGVIAFNFYEPLAELLAKNASFLSGFSDTLVLMTLFIVALVLLRLTTESIAPAMVRFPTPVYHLGRVIFGLAGAVLTMAIILVAFHTAPVHKKIFGVIDYKYAPPFKLGFDRGWLGFFQWTTGAIFPNYGTGEDPYREYGKARVFDPRSEWLLDHQDKRPYGNDTVQEGEKRADEPADAGAAGGAGGAGGGGGGGGGARPGDPKIIGPAVGGGVVVPN
jgi:hypothetical protein